jgi:hypothetical protein
LEAAEADLMRIFCRENCRKRFLAQQERASRTVSLGNDSAPFVFSLDETEPVLRERLGR